MTSTGCPKLWITYAWKDNEGGNFDFLVEELEKAGIDVTFDKVALIPGPRLWEQLAERIEGPTLHGWAILLTKASLASEPCKEEIAYALDRALRSKGEHFPLIGLVNQVQFSELPSAFRVRLAISLQNPDWVQEVMAGLRKMPPTRAAAETSKYIWKFQTGFQGDKNKLAIWVRPRFTNVRHWRFMFPADANRIGYKVGSPDQGLAGGRRETDSSRQMLTVGGKDVEVLCEGAGDIATPADGCFIVFSQPFPRFVAFGEAKGWFSEVDNDKIEAMNLT